jgi:ER lumen protein retaining receptor
MVPLAAAGNAHKPLTSPPPNLQALLLLWFVVEDHDTLFVLSESVHFIGIGLLAYKLIKKRGAGGAQATGCRRRHLLPASATFAAAAPHRSSSSSCPHQASFPIPLLAAGLSLRTQELTAAFLLVRLFCSFMMEYDIHTLLDFMTLLATGGSGGRVLGVGCCVLAASRALGRHDGNAEPV